MTSIAPSTGLSPSSAARPQQTRGPVTQTARVPALGQPLAQVDERYLLVQHEGDVRVLDLIGAQYQLLIMAQRRVTGREPVPLIFPAQVALDRQQMEALEASRERLEEVGIQWDALAESRIVVRSLPEVLHPLDTEVWLRQLLANAADLQGQDSKAWQEAIAEHAASARRYRLSQSEMMQVIRDLDALDIASLEGTCWRTLDAKALQKFMKGKS
ncbi:MAG: hypothetical protein HUJ29_07400 [Gammaproteobacteria bacterium]|nr:hypothetical protein [Gammaproteobacteria bacterium]